MEAQSLNSSLIRLEKSSKSRKNKPEKGEEAKELLGKLTFKNYKMRCWAIMPINIGKLIVQIGLMIYNWNMFKDAFSLKHSKGVAVV